MTYPALIVLITTHHQSLATDTTIPDMAPNLGTHISFAHGTRTRSYGEGQQRPEMSRNSDTDIEGGIHPIGEDKAEEGHLTMSDK